VVSHVTSLSRHTYVGCDGAEVAHVATAVLNQIHRGVAAHVRQAPGDRRRPWHMRVQAVAKVLDEFVKRETLE
jgi:hypothetical protein